mgnify:CR=1 FL=1
MLTIVQSPESILTVSPSLRMFYSVSGGAALGVASFVNVSSDLLVAPTSANASDAKAPPQKVTLDELLAFPTSPEAVLCSPRYQIPLQV